MTATPAVIGLSAGNRLLTTSFGPTDNAHPPALQFAATATPKLTVVAHRPSSSPHVGGSSPAGRARAHTVRALRNHSAPALAPPPPPLAAADPAAATVEAEFEFESSLEAIVLLQRSMLEKQWELPFEDDISYTEDEEEIKSASKSAVVLARSGVSARHRRMSGRRRGAGRKSVSISPELMQSRNRIYLRGTVSKELLTHKQVVQLSKKIKDGMWLQHQRSKLKEKLGNEPSYKQLAQSLRISAPELRARMRESFLAREMLTMSNIRLVISIAQKYDNLGVELADLIQGGLIGLLRGIEKFDASRGFRISTYVYWWIRQGVSRELAENSKTFRLPTYLHERLIAIRGAKYTLEDQGIAPTVENIAESLNISEKKVHNATEAVNKVLSLDQQAFPSLNGLPGETLHSYIEDQNVANDPWHGFEEGYLKEEVNNLINSTLNEREMDIIRLYHGIGLGKQCHTWEDISRQFGLSRERVRQIGLIAMEKLKHAARRKHLDALLEDY
ncbi:RNA polymerase sigma factor sigA-like [Phragmites australis]|uniref:RNA polymerase sigma factor sigA-like n=1 Tax=Phragmites australis TaxID=29695 RepID=UPI002D78D75B|nr:RNA polymerase sigma factor sigA-like [Phragmites australis]